MPLLADREHSLADAVAARLQQRSIPCSVQGSQIYVFESDRPGARALFNIHSDNAKETWKGFWPLVNISTREYLSFEMQSEYHFGYRDPLSVEISFLDWVSKCRFHAGARCFYGSPKEIDSDEYEKHEFPFTYQRNWWNPRVVWNID